MTKPAARDRLERPYADEHAASVTRPTFLPRSLDGRIRWFLTTWEAEVPSRTHVRGVWVGEQERNPERPQWSHELLGGSALGSPAWYSAFERYIGTADWPYATDADGFYLFPLHAAMGRLAHRAPMVAVILFRLGITKDRAAARPGMADDERDILIGGAIELLHRNYAAADERRRKAA